MNIYTKNIFKKLFHSLGWDIYRFTPSSSPQMQIITILKKKNVNLIFDIGANIGQFAKGLRSAGYQNQIISFEPLKSAHSKLLKIVPKTIWMVSPDQDPTSILGQRGFSF